MMLVRHGRAIVVALSHLRENANSVLPHTPNHHSHASDLTSCLYASHRSDIANFMTSKTDAQVHRHYVAVYLDQPSAPLPSGDPTVAAVVRPRADGGAMFGASAAASVGDAVGNPTGPKGGASSGRAGTGGGGGGGTPGYSHAHIPRTEVRRFAPPQK